MLPYQYKRSSTFWMPNWGINSENTKKIHHIVLDYRKVKWAMSIIKILAECVWNILHENLHTEKLYTKWVLRFLTKDQRQQSIDDWMSSFTVFRFYPNEILRRFVSMDITWIHSYTADWVQQAANWVVGNGWNTPKYTKDAKISKRNLDHFFSFGCTWFNIYRLSWEKQNSHSKVLCVITLSYE